MITKLSKGAEQLLYFLGVPRDAVTVGAARGEWIVYVLRRDALVRTQREVRELGGVHAGLPVRVVFCGPARPA